MGMLIDGSWHADGNAQQVSNGRYIRRDSQFRDWITADGSSGFKAEPGRYHLYIAVNCPWAHRTRIFRTLKKLEDVISMSIALPRRTDQGWVFDNAGPYYRDNCLGTGSLHEVYSRAQSDYSGSVTVPTLWDTQRETIVNNESSEIIRMLNSEFRFW